MLRYGIYRFDCNTYIVFDRMTNKEICVCSGYEGGRNYKKRAQTIARSLNAYAKSVK
jgi:hypothetical protein